MTDARARLCAQVQALEAGEPEAPSVLRRDRVDAHAEVGVRPGLEILHHRWIGAYHVGQVLRVSHPRQASFLLGRRQAGHVILGAFIDALDVQLRRGGQGRLFVEGLPVRL